MKFNALQLVQRRFFAFMRTVIFIWFVIISLPVLGQKRIDKVISDAGISTVNINGTNCFRINVTAQSSHNMDIKTSIAGEHNEEMMIVSERKNDTLFVSARFHPLFQADNDKLSAHKVMSIEMDLHVPEHLNLYITSDIAQVHAQGVFNNAIIELRDGSCMLSSFSGNAKINTLNGDIKVETNFAKINANTKHGQVNMEPLTSGENELFLKSIHGDISIFKIE